MRVTFVDAELWFLARLRADGIAERWPGLFLGRQLPDVPRWPAVTVTRQGGNPTRLWDTPRLGIRTHATSDKAATELAHDVLSVVSALELAGAIGDPVVTGVTEVTADHSETDKRYLSVQFRLRGVQSSL